MLAVVGSMPQFVSCHFLINLWCSFCPLLYIFCAEEFQPIILILKKAVLEQLTTKLLTTGLDPFETMAVAAAAAKHFRRHYIRARGR